MKLSYVLLVLAVLIPTFSSHAASKQWRGSTFDFKWSNPDNWDPPGVPQDGDDLLFENTGFPNPFTDNDLTNLTVHNLAFPSDSWQLTGNVLGVNGAIGNSGDGLVEIRCAIRLEGGGARFSAFSTLPSDSSDLRLTGPIDLNGRSLTLLSRSDATVDLAGPISGNGQITVVVETVDYFHAGTVKFSGSAANTFTGTVSLTSQNSPLFPTVVGSHLILDKESAIAVPGPLVVGTNCEVKLNRPHQIADNAAVSLGGGACLLLQDNTETIATLNMVGRWTGSTLGKSVVDTGGATLSVQGNITANNFYSDDIPTIKGLLGLPPGSHIIQVGGSNPNGLNIEAQIIGGGGFTKTGPGALLLSGNNTFDSDAVLHEGATYLYHANALGSPSGAAILDGGELHLENLAVGLKTLWVDQTSPNTGGLGGNLVASGISSWAGPVALNTNLVVSGTSMAFSGAVSGPGSLYLFNGTTHLVGSEANTYEGVTFLFSGLLELNKPSGVRAISSKLEAHAGGGGGFGEVRWLQDYQSIGVEVTLFTGALINLNGHRDDFGPITFNSGAISTGTGELGIYGLVKVNPSPAEATISGRLGLPPGLHEFRVSDGTAFPDLRIDATVLGAGSLRKTGAGQMWLTASNTYQGLTTVVEGVLSVLNPFGLGAADAGTTVDDGATLELNFAGTSMTEPLAIRGTGVNGNGALGAFGDATLRTRFPAIYAAIDLTTNATIAVATGSRLTVDGIISGIGPLTKAGAGTLVLANVNPNTYSGDTFVTEGVLNLSKPNSAISVPGNLIVGPAPLNSSAIARWSTPGGMNPDAIATINAGSLLDLNGNDQTLARLNLNDGGDAQTGAGNLSFPAGGLVNVGSLSLLGSHEGSSFTGNIGLPANATLTFAVSAFAPTPPFDFGPELDVNATIPAPVENVLFERAGLTKTGVGRMRIIGNNSFRGWVNVEQGTLTVAGSTALGAATSTGGTYVFNTSLLQLEGGVTIDGESLVLNSTAAPALEGIFGESYWGGPVSLLRAGTVGAAPNSLLQLAGVISGTGDFTKVGAGTLRFGGGDHNTYSGETFVNEGVLLMSKPTAITAVPGSLSIGTPAGLSAMAANLTSYQVVGNIFVNRGGLLNLNGQVENVDHLWLMEGGDVATSTGVLSVKTGGSIQVFPGAVNDPATISGILEFLAGTHNINVAASTTSTGGPDLDMTARVTSAGETVTLQKLNNGKLRLSANNDYVGTTVVNAGTLQVDGSQAASSVRVNGGARLIGNGRTGPVTFGSPTGIVAPGASPGTLQVGHFNGNQVGGILQLELNGPTPGTGYDRLTARGLVDLTGMTLQASVNFAAALDDQFLIVGNDFFDEIMGEFNGLPEGANLTLGDHIFQITYVGGDGNDVVLTKIGNLPALTIERVAPSSVRLLWPTNDPAFNLQFTTNLHAANWTAATPLPAVSGTNHVVTNAIGDARRFYRLFKP